jgi:hypothetical protein
MAVVYASESIALALHETVAHLRAACLPLNRYPDAGSQGAAIVRRRQYDPRFFWLCSRWLCELE